MRHEPRKTQRQAPKPKPRRPDAQALAARASLPIASPQMSNNKTPPNRRHRLPRKTHQRALPPSQFHSEPKGPGLYAGPHPPSTTLSRTAQAVDSPPRGPSKWEASTPLSRASLANFVRYSEQSERPQFSAHRGGHIARIRIARAIDRRLYDREITPALNGLVGKCLGLDQLRIETDSAGFASFGINHRFEAEDLLSRADRAFDDPKPRAAGEHLGGARRAVTRDELNE